MVLKVFILFLFVAVISISLFGGHIQNKEAYASPDKLRDKVDQILEGQKQIQSDLQLIKNALNTIKQKIDAQAAQKSTIKDVP